MVFKERSVRVWLAIKRFFKKIRFVFTGPFLCLVLYVVLESLIIFSPASIHDKVVWVISSTLAPVGMVLVVVAIIIVGLLIMELDEQSKALENKEKESEK